MRNHLLIFLCLMLTGCIWYIDGEGTPHRSTSPADDDAWDVWLEDPYAQCDYGGYWDVSSWYFEVYADSYLGPYEISEVGFYINNYDYQYMEYAGNGRWYRTFDSTYYDCDRVYHFDFVAVDYDGYEGYYTFYW